MGYVGLSFHPERGTKIQLEHGEGTGGGWLRLSQPDGSSELTLFGGLRDGDELVFVRELRRAVDTWYAELADAQVSEDLAELGVLREDGR